MMDHPKETIVHEILERIVETYPSAQWKQEWRTVKYQKREEEEEEIERTSYSWGESLRVGVE